MVTRTSVARDVFGIQGKGAAVGEAAKGRVVDAALVAPVAHRLQEAIAQRDYPLVQGIVVIVAALVVLVTVMVDLLVAWLDPRVSF